MSIGWTKPSMNSRKSIGVECEIKPNDVEKLKKDVLALVEANLSLKIDNDKLRAECAQLNRRILELTFKALPEAEKKKRLNVLYRELITPNGRIKVKAKIKSGPQSPKISSIANAASNLDYISAHKY